MSQSKDIKVLLIESQPSYMVELKKNIRFIYPVKKSIEYTYCAKKSEALRYLQQYQYDVVIIDDNMPDYPSLECLFFIMLEPNKNKEAVKIVSVSGERRYTDIEIDNFKFCDHIINKRAFLQPFHCVFTKDNIFKGLLESHPTRPLGEEILSKLRRVRSQTRNPQENND